MSEVVLTSSQIEELAKPFRGLVDLIHKYYENPENEKAFQDWYLKEYGHPAQEGV